MTSDTSRTTRPGGRTARVRQQVLDAATALLLTRAPGEITIGDVAARSGVHETTIYRRWGTRDALMTEVLLSLSADELEVPDTGSLRGDLVATVGAVADFLRTPAGYALAYLAATGDDETTTTLRDAFWADRFKRAQVLFDRAAERGEIEDAAIAPLAYEPLIATLHFRLLARRRPLDDDIAERLVDLVLDGVIARRPGQADA
jgi:AcrR family transcriptional regulator